MLHIHCMVDDDAGVVCESLCPAGALFEGKKKKMKHDILHVVLRTANGDVGVILHSLSSC